MNKISQNIKNFIINTKTKMKSQNMIYKITKIIVIILVLLVIAGLAKSIILPTASKDVDIKQQIMDLRDEMAGLDIELMTLKNYYAENKKEYDRIGQILIETEKKGQETKDRAIQVQSQIDDLVNNTESKK